MNNTCTFEEFVETLSREGKFHIRGAYWALVEGIVRCGNNVKCKKLDLHNPDNFSILKKAFEHCCIADGLCMYGDDSGMTKCWMRD